MQELTYINDVKHSQVKKPNIFIQAIVMAAGLVGFFFILGTMVFLPEILKVI